MKNLLYSICKPVYKPEGYNLKDTDNIFKRTFVLLGIDKARKVIRFTECVSSKRVQSILNTPLSKREHEFFLKNIGILTYEQAKKFLSLFTAKEQDLINNLLN